MARSAASTSRRRAGCPASWPSTRGEDLIEAGSKGLACRLPLRNRDGSPLHAPIRPLLAVDRVRFVGEGVAFVVAETLAQARDAAEAIVVDLDPLPAIVSLDRAAAPEATALHDDVPDNTALLWRHGDADAVEAAFASAAHVTRIALVNNRVTASPLEPRAAVAAFRSGRRPVYVACLLQGVFGMRNGVADALGVPAERLRVLTGDVGGSFGSKGAPYPEYALALHAARALGRPVKWRDDRSDSFVSDNHGRASRVEAELALDARWPLPRHAGPLDRRHGRVADTDVAAHPDREHRQEPSGALCHARCSRSTSRASSPIRRRSAPIAVPAGRKAIYIRERLIDAAAREMGYRSRHAAPAQPDPRDPVPVHRSLGTELR